MRQTDLAAQRVLDQLVAAHQALFTFSCRVQVEAIGEKRRESSLATIAYQKPNRARVEVVRGTTTTKSLSDGSTHLTGRRRSKADAGERAILEVISDAQLLIAPVFLYLVSRSAPTRTLLPGAVKTLGLGSPLVLDGVAVDVVLADVATGSGTARITFGVGKSDHLLRKLSIEAGYRQESLTLTELYTDVKANPRLDKALFALPKGS